MMAGSAQDRASILPRGPVILSSISGIALSIAVFTFFHMRLPIGIVYARSSGMAVLILGCLLLVFSERAVDKAWWKMPFPRTRRFWTVWLIVALSLPAIMEIPWLEDIFQVCRLTPLDWGWAVLLALVAVGWRSFGWAPLRKSFL